MAIDPRVIESNETMPFSGSDKSLGSHSFPVNRERNITIMITVVVWK